MGAVKGTAYISIDNGGYQKVLGLTGAQLQLSTEAQDASDIDDGLKPSNLITAQSWQVTGNYNLQDTDANFDALETAWLAGDMVDIRFEATMTAKVYTMTNMTVAINQDSQHKNVAKFTLTFTPGLKSAFTIA